MHLLKTESFKRAEYTTPKSTHILLHQLTRILSQLVSAKYTLSWRHITLESACNAGECADYCWSVLRPDHVVQLGRFVANTGLSSAGWHCSIVCQGSASIPTLKTDTFLSALSCSELGAFVTGNICLFIYLLLNHTQGTKIREEYRDTK